MDPEAMRLEAWFGLAALVMTVLAGIVLVPIVMRAMNEKDDSSRGG
jgi:hypothetical protein